MIEFLSAINWRKVAVAMSVIFYGFFLILVIVVFILAIIWGFG